MKPNKSIDGLSTRSAKKSATSALNESPSNFTRKKSSTSVSKTTTKKKPSSKASRAKSSNIPLTNTPSLSPKSSKPRTSAARATRASRKVSASINNSYNDPLLKKTQAKKANTTPDSTTASDQAPKQSVEDFLKPIQAFDFNENGELKESKDSVKDMKKHSKYRDKASKKKPSKKRRIITSVILVIVLILIGLITWAVFWGNDIIAKITGGQGNIFDLVKFVEPTYDPLKTDENGRTNILAFGTSGYNMEGDEGNGKHAGAQLTDSIMAISLNQETGDIAMVSLPRDLKASPTCTATGKINEVYWCNNPRGEDEEAGATALMTEVGSILGMDFQYYVHINWGSLVTIVNIVDGITITLDEPIHDYYYTKANYDAGVEYTLNGEQALGLARARHGTKGGDFTRGDSQQKILIAIKDKLVAKDLSITDYIDLLNSLGDNFRSNFSIDEFKTMAHLTFDFDFESMRQISLYPDYMTTGSINGISYVLPRGGAGNYGSIQSYVAKMISNDPRSYEEPSIAIYNASEQVGIASDENIKLTDEGYTISVTDNAPEGEYPTGTTIYAFTNKPGTKAMLEKLYNTSVVTGENIPASLPANYDFIIVLNPESEESENN